MRSQIGPWQRTPGIDWIHGDAKGVEAWGYEHEGEDASAWLRRNQDGTWSIRVSTDNRNQAHRSTFEATRRDAEEKFYTYLENRTSNRHGMFDDLF